MARKSPATFPEVHLSPARARAIVGRLLDWYGVKQRDLPWRETSAPYAILVSEFMLQQTQVATAMPYYRRFLKAFPTVGDLAMADEQDVLREWAGLGYYSRARNLQAAARKIVTEFGGRVPDGFAELLFLPGVGRYMAGAVASIAYGRKVAAVDANVARIACRLFALAVNPAATRARVGLEELVGRIVPGERPGDFNQALMDLGATICTAASPDCPDCPLREHCDAAREGKPEAYPALPKRRETVAVREAVAIAEAGGRYLLVQRPADRGRYRNMWEFPHVEVAEGDDALEALRSHLANALGVEVRVGDEWAEIRHQVTHHRITKVLYRCEFAGGSAPEGLDGETARMATPDEASELPMGAPHKKILALLRDSADLFGI